MDNFQKTVDLSDRLKKKPEPTARPRAELRPVQKEKEETTVKKKRISRARGIDQVYSEPQDEKKRNEFQQIERAKERPAGAGIYKFFTIIFGLALAASVFYFIYFVPGQNSDPKSKENQTIRWYAVKLVNEEMYYGQIDDTTADPVIIDKVYYNYDQLNQAEGETKNESGNLRLIKRGKETHGPEGSMSIVRAQILFMEPLKEDSPVLKAILDYEK